MQLIVNGYDKLYNCEKPTSSLTLVLFGLGMAKVIPMAIKVIKITIIGRLAIIESPGTPAPETILFLNKSVDSVTVCAVR